MNLTPLHDFSIIFGWYFNEPVGWTFNKKCRGRCKYLGYFDCNVGTRERERKKNGKHSLFCGGKVCMVGFFSRLFEGVAAIWKSVEKVWARHERSPKWFDLIWFDVILNWFVYIYLLRIAVYTVFTRWSGGNVITYTCTRIHIKCRWFRKLSSSKI